MLLKARQEFPFSERIFPVLFKRKCKGNLEIFLNSIIFIKGIPLKNFFI